MFPNQENIPNTVCELNVTAVSEVIRTVLQEPAYNIIKKVSLCNSIVQIRIDNMSQDVKDSLCE